MRVTIATVMMIAAAGQANAYCSSPLFNADLPDTLKYMACVIDEQNSKIDDLGSKIERLESTISDLESKINDLDR